ncbi:MAG: S-adenosyl-methyltransferase MraW [Myxococcales bacterium]|nr:S-adenosyl-methyltransferase MraW [Myxococcales bacterium]
MPEEALALLQPRGGAVYCDGTLGGGGHAERILAASEPDGRLIGIDRDPDALAAAGARLARFGDRVTLVHGAFGDALSLLRELGVDAVDGFLLDLGVSSPQLDRPERGFSFRTEGPLDMRMDPTAAETAETLIRRIGIDDLADLLRRYGDERYAGRIARAIKEGVMAGEITTTTELAAVVARTVPTRERSKDPATRTFQALRIAVNDELGQLERFLADFPDFIRVGGRVVVIAFHSLEDGLVKNRFRDLAKESGYPPDIEAKMGLPPPTLKVLTRKPLEPSEAEVAANPRARSAKLRGAERL